VRADARSDGLSVRGIAGSRVTTLAFDVEDDAREELLGFAVKRIRAGAEEGEWLRNYVYFAENDHADGPHLTDANPLQAFLWNDYAVRPGEKLTYLVAARYGSPEALETRREVEIELKTELEDDGTNGIYFNRGIAASQAYARQFHNKNPLGDREAEAWLSRGLREAFLEFVARAEGDGWGLRGGLFETGHLPALEAFRAARERGADVRLVVALPRRDRDGAPQGPTEHNVRMLEEAGVMDLVIPREHAAAIAHNKFVVLLHEDEPIAVWTGSTNITDSGFLGHSNLGHQVTEAEFCRSYLRYWQTLAEDGPAEAVRDFCEAESPIPGAAEQGSAEVFSPRQSEDFLDWIATQLKAAEHSVFFTAPFGLSEAFEEVIRSDLTAARYALMNNRESPDDFGVLEPDTETALVTGAYLGEGDWGQFLREKYSPLVEWAKFFHTKYAIVDPLSAEPLVITGSANFSPNSVTQNDENMLVIRGDQRVSDIYLTEFLRLFTHFRFRAKVVGDSREAAPAAGEPPPEGRARKQLSRDDTWTDAFWEEGPKRRERMLFSAAEAG
jgi:phosphatidylserine/phosphatidylglycerophosphate/cardiolipin synthase-like enzyme